MSDIRSELNIEAARDNLAEVMEFVDARLEDTGCSPKVQMQIDVAVEEIFVNIASYAYPEGRGDVTVCFLYEEGPGIVEVTFTDSGLPYDPLAKEDPDTSLSAEERKIGGLGIFMVKKSMDEVLYEYEDGKNILHLRKSINQ